MLIIRLYNSRARNGEGVSKPITSIYPTHVLGSFTRSFQLDTGYGIVTLGLNFSGNGRRKTILLVAMPI